MPTTNSAKKRLRQNVVRRARNRATRSLLKTEVRKVREAVAEADAEKAGAALREAAKKLDKAAARGVIHGNAAARIKSRLSLAVKNAKGATPTKAAKKPKAKKA
ncbi:MAG TPA: 30S ribosomal protein S20 [Pirellulales bacterium]|nr:30S ribosomal protein S20 [Pirellulales bacterium]